MDDRENYFDYVANVLGIKTVMFDQAEFKNETVPLLLVVQDLSTYSDPEKELLEKMIAALKMDPKILRLVDLREAATVQRGYTIEFLDEAGVSEGTVRRVFSPRTLLQKPALKKQAWDDLQKVIRHFS